MDDGVPPSNVHIQAAGFPVLRSVKLIDDPASTGGPPIYVLIGPGFALNNIDFPVIWTEGSEPTGTIDVSIQSWSRK